jgi:hypothetical protein
MVTMTEAEILDAAARELAPLGVHLERSAPVDAIHHGIDLLINSADRRFLMAAEVKRHITQATAAAVHEQVKRAAGPDGVVLAQHITPQVAETLRDLGQQFIDGSGNVYLRAPGLLIWHVGRRARPDQAVVESRASAAAIKIQFGLLVAPDLANAPLRVVSNATITSLGSVQTAMKDLEQRAHLIRRSGRRILVDRAPLLDDWVASYLRVLRPRLFIGRFVGESSAWWMSIALPPDLQWGGEVAAAKLTGFLRPQQAVVYAGELPKALLTAHRLRRASSPESVGVIEFRRRFWRHEAVVSDPADTVPALLTYADLLAVGDARTVEAAERVRHVHLAGVLVEP